MIESLYFFLKKFVCDNIYDIYVLKINVGYIVNEYLRKCYFIIGLYIEGLVCS